MAINIADKIVGLITSMTPDEIADLPPVERRRLADHCKHVVALCEFRPLPEPKSGVLLDLRKNGMPR